MAVSKRLRFEILKRDGHRCRYCGRGAPEVRLTVDHVLATALGGTDDPANLVTACVDCNAGKSSTAADAAHVEAVAQAAVRWSDAIREAAQVRAAKRAEMDQAIEELVGEWESWTYETTKTISVTETFPRPANWRDSVERFLSLGLASEDLVRAARISIGNTKVRSYDKWAYFCGVCWKEIERLQEVATQIAEQGNKTEERPPTLEDLP